ncbi:hypothetical protein FKG94_09480 [Exilibacterium tricleocarpae]|uniref:Uncharacterized protein n=1 Tax=Exilibacterium tricleocarpae TaxID=2591008 RepID=A0A545TVT0_9GAMM|nr:hypothetical protein [Exilibacterium tricleocarpae]TQV81314.1 hypothetical protein FKG94_09480 [Exilibacterium tricleocarpae]
MSSQPVLLSDTAFIEQFENKTLDPAHFNHLGHLRLGWLYLNENKLDVAIERICRGIKAYAESLGASEKFHLTMTDAIMRIMARRIDAMADKNWHLFLQQNPDIVEDFKSVLHNYYSKGVLSSTAARTSLISPDIKSI